MLNVLLAAALSMALAQNTFGTISGTLLDPSDAVLPGVRVIAFDAERDVRYEAFTDGAGRFMLGGLPRGDYSLEADLPGFEMYQERLTLNGDDLTREITLGVGMIQESISVSRRSNVLEPPLERFPQRPPYCGEGPRPPVDDRPRSAGALPPGLAPVRVGGVIRTPRKVFHVDPVYPDDADAGIVRINAVIGLEGFVTETEVTNRPSPELAQAAIAAVRQWEFDPTLLNCEPVQVRMTVVVDFR